MKENITEMRPEKEVKDTTSPYLNARREWNERYSDFIIQANNWRLIALGSTAGMLICLIGLVWVSVQHKVVPYVIETNKFGEVSRIQRADEAGKPNISQTKAALRDWIIGARTVYVDLRAEKSIVEKTYSMTLPESSAFQTLANYHRQNNPYQRAAQETVEVSVNAVVPMAGDTWQVEWTETTRQRSGKILDMKHWQGSFTITIAPPTDEQQILVNALGIYVSQFAWTPRIN